MRDRVTIPGSRLSQVAAPHPVTAPTALLARAARVASGAPLPAPRLAVALVLRAALDAQDEIASTLARLERDPLGSQPLGAAALAKLAAASPDDVAAVLKLFEGRDDVTATADGARRRVSLTGTVSALEELFGVELALVGDAASQHLEYAGEISLPAEIADQVRGVAGLERRPVLRRSLALAVPTGAAAAGPGAATPCDPQGLTTPLLSPQQVAALYGFPAGVEGAGQTIVVLEQGGGYWPADLATYFESIRLPVPRIETRGVNAPGSLDAAAQTMCWLFGPDQLKPAPDALESGVASVEVGFDLQTVGAFANEARILAYFLADGSMDALLTALWDVVLDEELDASVITGSFAAIEEGVPPMTARLLDDVVALCALRGITVVFPSGDYGAYGAPYSGDGQRDSIPLRQVMLPAANPRVLAVGGTRLMVNADKTKITGEVAFFQRLGSPVGQMASGGGFSTLYARPSWQATALDAWRETTLDATGDEWQRRGVPDTAFDAHQFTGWPVYIAGTPGVAAGTSVAAPAMACFIVRLNQLFGRRLGLVNPLFYTPHCAHTFYDIVHGNSDLAAAGGAFNAQPGWDPVTGLGALRGGALIAALRGPLGGARHAR